MDVFPAFVPLAGSRVVIVGEGEAADAKARLFEGSPAELVRERDPARALLAETYAGFRLAFIALPEALAARAAGAARSAGALINVVDQPALCDFHTPSIVDRGSVVGAIGTGGVAPLLASRLRTEWEARWPPGLGRLAALLGTMRPRVRAQLSDIRERRTALARIMEGPAGAAALAGDMAAALRLAEAGLSQPGTARGEVVRIAAPLDPELLTVRDLRRLARADRVIASDDVHPDILVHARRDAVRLPSADEASLAAWAGAGETVVVISAAPIEETAAE